MPGRKRPLSTHGAPAGRAIVRVTAAGPRLPGTGNPTVVVTAMACEVLRSARFAVEARRFGP
jgi:hypothetical protein